jgi:flagellar FliJ protein
MERIFVVAKSEERQGCQEMGHAQRLLDAEISRLDELLAYRQSYEKKASACSGIQPTHLLDYQKFLSRLGSAVTEQQKHVMTGKQNRDLHRERWMVKRRRLDSLQHVVERYRKSEVREEEQKAQKILDDHPLSRNAFSR